MGKKQPKSQVTWIKNHPLEGNGIITGLYGALFKRNPKSLKSCKDVFIPDTVIYDHNFPHGWYTTDVKVREIVKKQGKELDAASIQDAFQQLEDPKVLITAVYMCSYDVTLETGETVTSTQVEFFNDKTIKDFIARKEKSEGILQRFVIPKGKQNCVIEAIWSPLVFSCKRRCNKRSVTEKMQCMVDPYPCAVTYEGPPQLSTEGSCGGKTVPQIKEVCKNIVEHFYNAERKYITRMVLYFKIDENNQPWLLWCGSLRITDRSNQRQEPICLSHVFTSPSLHTDKSKEQKMLLDADLKELALTRDLVFYDSYVRPQLKLMAGESGVRGEGIDGADDLNERGKRKKKGIEGVGRDQYDLEQEEAWKEDPEIKPMYQALCIARDYVLHAIEDIFYKAYAHFLKCASKPVPFIFDIDAKAVKIFSQEHCLVLMGLLHIERAMGHDAHESVTSSTPAATPPTAAATEADAISSEGESISGSGRVSDLWFSIGVVHQPLAYLSEKARHIILLIFGQKENELRNGTPYESPIPVEVLMSKNWGTVEGEEQHMKSLENVYMGEGGVVNTTFTAAFTEATKVELEEVDEKKEEMAAEEELKEESVSSVKDQKQVDEVSNESEKINSDFGSSFDSTDPKTMDEL